MSASTAMSSSVDEAMDATISGFDPEENGEHMSTQDMNKLVIDYLISEGYREAAERLCQESGIEFPEQNTEHLDARIVIRNAIVEGDIAQAIALINDLVPELLDKDQYLHFHLLQQQLIELIRASKVEESLKFAQEHLVEKGEQLPCALEEIEKTMALLAFERPEQSPFANLLNVSHRYLVAAEANSAVLAALHRPSTPRLEALIRMILWAEQQLNKQRVSFVRIVDMATATSDGEIDRPMERCARLFLQRESSA